MVPNAHTALQEHSRSCISSSALANAKVAQLMTVDRTAVCVCVCVCNPVICVHERGLSMCDKRNTLRVNTWRGVVEEQPETSICLQNHSIDLNHGLGEFLQQHGSLKGLVQLSGQVS